MCENTPKNPYEGQFTSYCSELSTTPMPINTSEEFSNGYEKQNIMIDGIHMTIKVLNILLGCIINMISSFREDFLHTVYNSIHYLQGHQWPHRVRQLVGKAVEGKVALEAQQHLLVCLQEH